MKDGHAVAFGLGTQVPAGSIMDLASAMPIKLLDQSSSFDGMKKLNPGYTLVTIKKGSYPGQDKDVKVIGYATHIPAMAAVNGAMKTLTVKEMAADIGVPLHPGAAKYYKEAGAI
jgi:TRAP-type uncharacterized transport system substrate-binding protein